MYNSPLNRMIDNVFGGSGFSQQDNRRTPPGTFYTYTTQHVGKADNAHVKYNDGSNDEDGVTTIRIVVAGVSKENIDVEVHEGNRVVIRVTRDESLKDLGLATEEEFQVDVRHNFNVEDAKTKLENGILEIQLTKIEDDNNSQKIVVN